MSSVHFRNLGIPRNQPADREGLSRTRRAGGGNLGHSGGWQIIEENHTHSAIHFQIQQKHQTRGLEGYGSSASAPPTPQRPFPMEHGQQEVQTIIQLGRTRRKFPEDMYQRDTVTTTQNDPPLLVLQQFQTETKLGPIGHTVSLWLIWHPLVLYGLLAISLFPGQLWPQAISCHHWPPWPIPISSTSRPLSLFWAWGSLCLLGGSEALALIICFGTTLFIRGVLA
ncbi:hypothetical protein O181_057787 [Austropuccinia psidii MF-1]|uniref:Uncharacterized protein n=1 Tax=Austropuccinia psidii MF-1 TaxID=1389203 RepID=A0A9Q3EIG0_9BASI|nr:hypothetical protein [Austropuccinia psidii MF-1]